MFELDQPKKLNVITMARETLEVCQTNVNLNNVYKGTNEVINLIFFVVCTKNCDMFNSTGVGIFLKHNKRCKNQCKNLLYIKTRIIK